MGGGKYRVAHHADGTSGSAKKDEDFDPVVLSDIASRLHSLRLHEDTPNFEGMEGWGAAKPQPPS